MNKPIIGVLEYPYKDKDCDLIYEVLSPIIESISKSGGIPIGIFPTQIADFQNERLRNIPELSSHEKNDIVNSIKMCDAIIKPGALKIFEFDRFVYEYVLKENIPYLGICAGMQVMASYGKEFICNKKIENTSIQHKVRNEDYAHEIKLLSGKLKKMLKKNKIMVNSRHLYQIEDSGINKVSALSKDGVIEAIENPLCDFNIGLQWHPELMKEDENSKIIFNHFVDAAENYSYKKKKK